MFSRVITVSLAILVSLVIVYFFVTNFSEASNSVSVMNNSCQSMCQSLMSAAFNYDSCSSFLTNKAVASYVDSCPEPCMVTVRGGVNCVVK